MDLLLICSLGILINVLCHDTYTAPGWNRLFEMNDTQARLWGQYDVNGLSEEDRKLFCLARGRSIELVTWLSLAYTTGITDMPVQKLFATIFINTCKMLCDYKWKADNKRLDTPPNFTIERVKIQIYAVLSFVVDKVDLPLATFEELDWDSRKWKLPTSRSHSISILPPHVTGMNILSSSALPYKPKHQSELFRLGETALDKKFAKRLEVKRENIGLSCHVLILIFYSHVGFRQRCSNN